ncbi:recombinase RecT [Chryseobacterium camelliae]|uniref:Recombinase RecT n=1 Tax=Chryseobacterium camelliae TaxID=1265445 RepID=A0ABY7QLR4_9FLAO|nr:recombinase RecT [Chryseobacterium camelliae]WBV60279.1 recombinase RecT [Chryseobacterium camelliae]
MSNTSQKSALTLFNQSNVQDKFEKLLGKKAQGFISSVLQIVNANKLLQNADPMTVYNAAATAAVLDLPIDPNLGFAWIVPYKGKAQFQMGWKGFVQLALRTGQYKRINVTEVYENQFKSFNRLTEELDSDFGIDGDGEIVGYASYFKLNNGMEKLTYWSRKEIEKHAQKYSQAYGKGSMSPWNDKDQFHAMAKKTVLKNMISKWGIMSIEMQTAHLADQSIQQEEGQYDYADNSNVIDVEAENINEEEKRVKLFIDKAETIEQLEELKESVPQQLMFYYEAKVDELNIA